MLNAPCAVYLDKYRLVCPQLAFPCDCTDFSVSPGHAEYDVTVIFHACAAALKGKESPAVRGRNEVGTGIVDVSTVCIDSPQNVALFVVLDEQ